MGHIDVSRQYRRQVMGARLRFDDNRIERALRGLFRQRGCVFRRNHRRVFEDLFELSLDVGVAAQQENAKNR